MQEVVKQLSERMVLLGHEVIVLTRFHPNRTSDCIRGVKVVDFKIEGNPFSATTPEEKRYVDYLLGLNGDIITFFAAQQWATNLALDILPQLKPKKVSVPTGYSGLYKEEYNDYFQKMRTWIHSYDLNVYLSDDYRDSNFAKACGVQKRIVIPNGASVDEFAQDPGISIREKYNIPKNHKILLHLGSYTGRKGHKELLSLFLKSKLTNCTLLMIGNEIDIFKNRSLFKFPFLLLQLLISKLGSRKVIFTEADRKTTVSAYFQSDLFIFPSQIECSPIVLFESAAAGLPFFATDVGNAIEIAKWTGAGEIMATIRDNNGFSFPDYPKAISQLEGLLFDNKKLNEMSVAGRRNWIEHFTWESIALRYAEEYKKLLE